MYTAIYRAQNHKAFVIGYLLIAFNHRGSLIIDHDDNDKYHG